MTAARLAHPLDVPLLDVDAIAARHPAVFQPPLARRLRGPALVFAALLYVVFCVWFFAIGTVLSEARWGRAGAYLADWVSYEIQARVRFEGDRLGLAFPRYAPWREDRLPADMTRVDGPVAGGAVALDYGAGASLLVRPGRVVAERDGETFTIRIAGGRAEPDGAAPAWADVRDGEVRLSFGFAGAAEVEGDEVKTRRRYLGWENFLFDPASPFWGRSAGEVIGLLASDARVDPALSNPARAWNDIWFNAEWQHGDVWTKLLQTVVMAFVGTLFAALLAFPLAFIAARNISPSRTVGFLVKRGFDFLRCVDMLIWALFFTRAFGQGPISGIAAIFFTDTGTLGKVFSESLENLDEKEREGVRATGASPALVQRYGVMPQVLPVFASQTLYFWESNTRSATIIGAVGAGGIGLKLWEAMRTNADWENVAYMVILILLVVFLFDGVSNAIRRRLMGEARS